jgi:hypothetical protein
MGIAMKAIETTGRIDAAQRLVLDQPLPLTHASHVRVIILLPEDDDIGETEWLHAAVADSAFDFLRDPAEDLYTLADGEPFDDEA